MTAQPNHDQAPGHGGQRLGSRPGCYVVLLVLLIAAGALAFRLQRLELRPFHGDEAVQAVKTGELCDGGQYRYDPYEFHGPSLYYLTLPVLKLSGARSFAETTDADFRLVPVLFGVGLILLLFPLHRDLGGVATLAAALLLAVSPAMVFFSRYYIQEMLLVGFAALALAALWRYLQAPRPGRAMLLGLAVGLMLATKETSVIFGGALAAATGALLLRRRCRDGRAACQPPRRQIDHLLLAAAVAVLVAGLFYSSFLTHPRGPLDALLALPHYLERSGGGGSAALHQQPWYYYLKMLGYTKDAPGPRWSEGLILALAAAGFLATAVRACDPAPCANQKSVRPTTPACHPDLALFLAVYTLCLTVAFALIPYKTPWNMLGFLHGLILMAGIGTSAIFHRLPGLAARTGLVILLLLGSAQLTAQAVRANFRFCADPRNPYVYAHPVADVIRLARRLTELAALHPDATSMRIHFITPDYWPLPYYLRRFSQVGYWSDIPAAPDAPVIIASCELQDRLHPALGDRYHTEFYGLRPGVLLVLNIQQDLWDRYLARPK